MKRTNGAALDLSAVARHVSSLQADPAARAVYDWRAVRIQRAGLRVITTNHTALHIHQAGTRQAAIWPCCQHQRPGLVRYSHHERVRTLGDAVTMPVLHELAAPRYGNGIRSEVTAGKGPRYWEPPPDGDAGVSRRSASFTVLL